MPATTERLTHAERAKRRAEIRKFVAAGHKRTEAADRFGVTATVVRDSCAGLPRTSLDNRWGGSTFKILADLLNTSDTLQAIGERNNVTRQCVNQALTFAKAAGIKFPHRKLPVAQALQRRAAT